MNEIIEYLRTRRSVPAANLKEPSPSSEEISTILQIATRVPDHGKLAPWRFIIFQGEARIEIGKRLLDLLESRNQELIKEQRHLELTRLSRAPLVIGVVSRATEHPKIPVWEQQLSAGAVCINILHAAHTLGYAGQWLSEWYLFDDEAGKIMGLKEHEKFAGFIHIGTPEVSPVERERPDVQSLVTYYDG